MKCPTCGTPLTYGVCSNCQEAKYEREERQAIQSEPYWEPGIYKGET